MSTALHRWGLTAARHPVIVLAAWLLVALGVVGLLRTQTPSVSTTITLMTPTPALGLMIGLVVGISYALFIVHRYRRTTGTDKAEAVAQAVATAGRAVLFAGSTVVIVLLGLLVLRIGFVTTMAVTAAVTVMLAVALALSAVPALLALLPRPRPVSPTSAQPGRFDRAATSWMRVVTRHPWVTIGGVVVGLGALAVPAASLQLGMPWDAVAATGSDQRTTYDEVTDTLDEGANAPLLVVVQPTDGTVDLDQMQAWQQQLDTYDGVVSVRLMGAAPDHSLALFTVVSSTGPTDQATSDLVTTLRSTTLDGAESLDVTGMAAPDLDLTQRLADAIPVYVAIVAGLSLLVLVLVFRSVLLPVTATAGFLLSIGATMGLVVTAFSHQGWLVGVDRPGPILSFLPIMATGVLYGLAMNHQVFLGASVREAYLAGTDAREAIVVGFRNAGAVVVAAVVIMVSVFAGFVLSDDTTIRQLGFALSAGVLIDAFVVRMALVPAVLQVAGRSTWWFPGRRTVRS
jgi:putative drug exporter of the RND superfamily